MSSCSTPALSETRPIGPVASEGIGIELTFANFTVFAKGLICF